MPNIKEVTVICLGCKDLQDVTLVNGTLSERKFELENNQIYHQHNSTKSPCKIIKGRESK